MKWQRNLWKTRSKPVMISEHVIVAIMSLIVGILVLPIVTLDGIVRRRPGSGRLIVTSLVSTLVGILLASAVPSYIKGKCKAREAEVRSNIHAIQLALDRYYYSHNGVFPVDIETMVENDYLDEIPINVFTGEPMREIPFGAYPYQGEFTYIPFTRGNEIKAYYIIAYGAERGKGLDVDEDGLDDHVILVGDNGRDVRFTNSPWLDPIGPPPLKEVLKSPRESSQTQSTVMPENIK